MPESVEEETVATSTLAQPLFRAEDHACSNTRRRTTGGPPDSNSTMIQRLTSTHLRLSPTSIYLPTLKVPLQKQLHHLQSNLPSHSSPFQRRLRHLSQKLQFNTTISIQKSLNLFPQNQFVYFLTFSLDTQPHFLVRLKLQISIIFLLLTLSSMLLATFLMMSCLKTC